MSENHHGAHAAPTSTVHRGDHDAHAKHAGDKHPETGPPANPWPALWALVIGFFMILIDSTIVSVATPAIMRAFDANITNVVWVTSAYLLTYAVPLLITGRLGDRFGPKNIYLGGLVLFTLASAACGFATTIGLLIAARAVQGLGAALMTPQTMAVITRTFPPERRGTAMALWGSTAGVAVLVGPLLGGLLVDGAGWEWIFFVNVPIGLIGFVLALRLVPRLETHTHKFDLPGVLLSAVAMFLIVFGIQEGETYHWGRITGVLTVWRLIGAGVVVLALFLVWQRVNRREPLLPLGLFTDRNFALANVGIAAMGFITIGMGFPIFLYTQTARGLSPTQSALLLIPMALLSGGLAPITGKMIDRGNPKWLAVGGFIILCVSLLGYYHFMQPQYSILWLLVPSAVMGIGNSGIWGPLSVTATRNLPPQRAGAGSGVYNMTRQVGAVVGSAAIAALMQSRLSDKLGGGGGASPTSLSSSGAKLPAPLVPGFSSAMAQTLLLPAAVCVIGILSALFFARPKPRTAPVTAPASSEQTSERAPARTPESTPRPTPAPEPAG